MLFVIPDPATYGISLEPWSAREARFISDVRDYSKEPLRETLCALKTLEQIRRTGCGFFTGPDMGFWLFKPMEKRRVPAS